MANISEAKYNADEKSHAKIYDDVILKVRKDAEINGDYIRAHAAARGESMNGFIKRAITETIELDKEKRWWGDFIMARSDDSEAKKAADARWNKKTYEQLKLSLRKDSKINGEFIKGYANARGESVNSFLLRAVTETIERDKQSN